MGETSATFDIRSRALLTPCFPVTDEPALTIEVIVLSQNANAQARFKFLAADKFFDSNGDFIDVCPGRPSAEQVRLGSRSLFRDRRHCGRGAHFAVRAVLLLCLSRQILCLSRQREREPQQTDSVRSCTAKSACW